LKIDSDETENPNEIEYNLETKKAKNHEVEYSQRERETKEEIITSKIQIEKVRRT
jgi:hypothetical protein